MMKNSLPIISLLLAVAAIVISILVLNDKKRIVYVDSVKLITGYKGSKIAKEGYEKKAKVWQSQVDTLASEMNAQLAKHKKDKVTMSPKEIKLSEELLANKQQQLQSYRQLTLENAKKEDQLITAKVFGEIDAYLKKYGEKNNLEFILGATQAGNIVYAKRSNDITEEVLLKMNEDFEAGHK